MPKGRLYLKNLVLFFLITCGLFLLTKVPWLQSLRDLSTRYTGANWFNPLLFFLAILAGSFLIRVEREEENKKKAIFGGILLVVLLALARYGLPHPAMRALFSAGPFWFFNSFLEEFFFRRVGFEAMRRNEEKFYREPTLKKLGPVSFLLTCLMFAAFHSFDIWNHGDSWWSYAHYAYALDASVRYTLLYIMTRTIWVPGTAHFLTVMVKYLW